MSLPFFATYDYRPSTHTGRPCNEIDPAVVNLGISNRFVMKISKPILLAIAAAIAITTVSCTKEKPDPKEQKTEKKLPPENCCPFCGMG